MIKTILKLLVEVLGKRLVKSGIEEQLLKNQNYINTAKRIWGIVDENFRISKNIEDKLVSKADEFDKLLLAKFPELSQEDITELRQAVAGEVNQGKDVVLNQIDALKQLQDANNKLQAENIELKEQLNKVQSAIGVNVQA